MFLKNVSLTTRGDVIVSMNVTDVNTEEVNASPTARGNLIVTRQRKVYA
jgi:hypothetical protein